MIATFQGDEMGARNPSREPAALIKWLHGVIAAMKNQGRCLYVSQEICDIDLIPSPPHADCVLGRGGLELKVVPPPHLLRSPVGNEQRREDLAKGRVVSAQPSRIRVSSASDCSSSLAEPRRRLPRT